MSGKPRVRVFRIYAPASRWQPHLWLYALQHRGRKAPGLLCPMGVKFRCTRLGV